MKGYLRTVLILIVLMIFFVGLINFIVDPGSIFLKKILKTPLLNMYVEALTSSQYGVKQKGWKERDVKVTLAEKAKDAECVVLGSSHVMGLSIYQVEGFKNTCKSLINLGVSGGGLEDIGVFSNILIKRPGIIKNKKIFIGIDPWTFNFNRDSRYIPYSREYKQLLEKLGKLDDFKVTKLKYSEKLYKNLISLDYFVGSLRYVRKKGLDNTFREIKAILETHHNAEAYILSQYVPKFDIAKGIDVAVTLPDGSHVYSAQYISDAKRQKHQFEATRYKLIDGQWYDENAVDLFISIVSLLESHGYSVIVVQTPYHHNVWDNPSGAVTRRAMHIVSNLIKQLKLKTIGSYNPRFIGCEKSEFFDYMHAGPSCINKIFQGSTSG